MTILLADKEVFPLELLELGPLLFVPGQGHIQVEQLIEQEDEE